LFFLFLPLLCGTRCRSAGRRYLPCVCPHELRAFVLLLGLNTLTALLCRRRVLHLSACLPEHRVTMLPCCHFFFYRFCPACSPTSFGVPGFAALDYAGAAACRLRLAARCFAQQQPRLACIWCSATLPFLSVRRACTHACAISPLPRSQPPAPRCCRCLGAIPAPGSACLFCAACLHTPSTVTCRFRSAGTPHLPRLRRICLLVDAYRAAAPCHAVLGYTCVYSVPPTGLVHYLLHCTFTWVLLPLWIRRFCVLLPRVLGYLPGSAAAACLHRLYKHPPPHLPARLCACGMPPACLPACACACSSPGISVCHRSALPATCLPPAEFYRFGSGLRGIVLVLCSCLHLPLYDSARSRVTALHLPPGTCRLRMQATTWEGITTCTCTSHLHLPLHPHSWVSLGLPLLHWDYLPSPRACYTCRYCYFVLELLPHLPAPAEHLPFYLG